MQITQDFGQASYIISAYEPGRITVNQSVHTRSLVVMPERLIDDWVPQDFDALCPEHFEPLIALRPDILILGTGARQRFPDTTIQRMFSSEGIGLEIMDTAAACRTYDILMSEGRSVAAALLMIEGT